MSEIDAQSVRSGKICQLDDIIVFHTLTEDDVKDIARLRIRELCGSLAAKGLKLEVADEVVENLTARGNDPVFGARPDRDPDS